MNMTSRMEFILLLTFESSILTCIFSALLTTSVFPSIRFPTQTSLISSNDSIFSFSSSPSVSTSLLAFIIIMFFLHYKATWPKPRQQKHLMSWLRKVGVTLLPLTMTEVSFFSLGYSTLPYSFCYDGPPLVLAFQLGFQGLKGLNSWLCRLVPFCLSCFSTFTTICTISSNSI